MPLITCYAKLNFHFSDLRSLLPRRYTCDVLCIMRPYSEGRLNRYRIAIPRELSEIRTQPWLSEGFLPAIHVTTGNPSINCAATQFHHQCPCFHIMNGMLECYLGASNHQPFDYWRAHHVYYVASQPRTSDRLISHWIASCLLAYDN